MRIEHVVVLACLCAAAGRAAKGAQAMPDGTVVKAVLGVRHAGGNLLKADSWRPWEKGFRREGKLFACDNAADARAQRGVSQTVVLNQTRPEPIVAVAWSKAEGVGGSPNSDYSLYLDLVYTDGTPLWGQISPFSVGTHDWQRREVRVLPQKPVRSVSFHMLLRRHAGKAWFRGPELRLVRAPKGAFLFDGVAVTQAAKEYWGFQVRDVAADSDFVRIEREALGLKLERVGPKVPGWTLTDTTGKDRAVTLVFTVPCDRPGLRWLVDPRRSERVEAGREYTNTRSFRVGTAQGISIYPFAAVAAEGSGYWLGIDLDFPAVYRCGYNASSQELFLAFDIGLAPEKPSARVAVKMNCFPGNSFREALATYYGFSTKHFQCETPEQGLWMPFAKISAVKGWEDFGFKFKEGTNETKWDDAHGITTFRYTEPMTWWMRMPKGTPRTLEAALAQARQMAGKGDKRAMAFLTSSYHNEAGQFPARLLDTPWCNGAVWSMNSMPGIKGEVTDFKNKWNAALIEKLYGPKRAADQDGEYIDSSEGYVTDELDFRRDHFAAAQTPLTFSPDSHKPAIFRGLIAFEYVRAVARDVHARGKLMMANSTPIRLCWLAPLLEVMGTETNWNPGGRWRPMSDAELLYRRAMCKGKPYCFLMNTPFEQFSHALVEKYMKRALAYGMFPGFFSHNASQGQYFTRPKLYNRDRPLFKKYVPLCKQVAEAGWEPVTNARSSDPKVYVERFGDRYLTVFNDSRERRTVAITLGAKPPKSSRELVSGKTLTWQRGGVTLELAGEDVAVIQLR